MAVVRVEQQRQREQPWRRWDEAAILPLPRRNRTDSGVEKIEETTARLQEDGATCFRGGERARRQRRVVGNGGRLLWLGAARGEGERKRKWRGECVGRFLKLVSHCSIHSDEENRLTSLFQRVNTANLLHLCKNGVYEKCRSTIHLQFLFKDHSLIRHGSAVT